MLNRIFILSLALFLFACKKENSKHFTEVYLTITNFESTEPISGLTIRTVARQEALSVAYGSDEHMTLDTKTSTDAEYHFSFKAKSGSRWTYQTLLSYSEISSNGYYIVLGDEISHAANSQKDYTLSEGEINSFEVNLIPECMMGIHLINGDCYDENDLVDYKINYLAHEDASIDWTGLPRSGCYNQFFGYNEYPSGDYEAILEVTKNNSTYFDTIPFILLPNQEQIVYLEY